jgi:hypothetical protein
MRRLWWPEPLYEARPYAALVLGLLGGALALAHAAAVGSWELRVTLAFAAGCVVLAYGAVVLLRRFAYRRRSRWNRERRR